MAEPEGTDALRGELRAAWRHYVDVLAPLRPVLHGYCRRLAGNVFDAEDLVQDTLLRAFGQWGVTYPRIHNPRAYLLRTATNVWIDQQRRLRTEARAPDADPGETESAEPAPERASELRDAGARLLQHLSPQERAAVVLKEVCEMRLEEIAEVLATTVGAVKAALHRGRGRLAAAEAEPEDGGGAPRRARPSPELLDRFLACVGARDMDGLVALMLDGATAENLGNSYHAGMGGADGTRRFLRALLFGHPDWPEAFQAEGSRLERAELHGEWVVLGFSTRRGREALEAVFRLEERDGRIARIRSYAFCPETMRELGETLGRRVRTGLYRAPEPPEVGPGRAD